MTTATAFEIRTLTPHPTLEYWSVCKIEALFETPFLDLVYRAAQVHRENFNPKAIQLSTLMSIKTGMSRGLWLLSAVSTLSYWSRKAAITRCGRNC